MNSVNDQQDIKKEKILEAAHQRFLHYGYSKTTMNEIAGDLALSKALLYYYFPDKSQLYIAVMRKLANEYLGVLNENADRFTDLKEAFLFQINTNHEFIVNNYNFFDFFKLNEQNLPDTIWEIVNQIHGAEKLLLVNMLNKEIASGKIAAIKDPEKMIDLLLDAIEGIRSNRSQKKNYFPKREQLDEIRDKRLLLTDIMIKGLRCS
jgi:TetR/AcrR family transcriptional repressor of mexJK operon